MSHIFLSYANEDRELARRVVGLLEKTRLQVWWDRRIPAGMNWNDVLDKALSEMQCMVVLWTRHSVESDWVYEEADEGRKRGMLLPVLLEAVMPPRGFRSIQCADLSGWDGNAEAAVAQQLLIDLKALAGIAKEEDNQPLSLPPRPAPVLPHSEIEAEIMERPASSAALATSTHTNVKPWWFWAGACALALLLGAMAVKLIPSNATKHTAPTEMGRTDASASDPSEASPAPTPKKQAETSIEKPAVIVALTPAPPATSDVEIVPSVIAKKLVPAPSSSNKARCSALLERIGLGDETLSESDRQLLKECKQ